MNVHGPKFHRSQHTDFFVFHKPLCKKNTFTLIFIVTLMLAMITLHTSAATGPGLVARPGSLAFGNVAVAGNSARTMTVVNSGNTVITISQVSVSGRGFSVSKLATPLKLSAGQSISLQAHFAPEATAEFTGSIAITSNAADRNLTIALSGRGVEGRLSATPPSASFGNVAMGGNNSKTLTLSNYGLGSATISQVSVSGKGFSVSKLATPLKLSAGQSISLQAHFAPEAAGEVTGSIAITSNAWDRNLTIALSGRGVEGRLSATPPSASFGNVAMGGNNSKTLTLSNYGLGSATISQVSVSGKGFSVSKLATPLKLSAGQSISLQAHFAPEAAGEVTGSIAITSNAWDRNLTIALSGRGVEGRLSATPASASFGNVAMGSNNSKTLTLSNYGLGSATISRVSVSGKGFTMSKLATPLKLSAGQSISLQAHFAPEAAGEVTGSIAITSNAWDRNLTIALSGRGVEGRLSATPPSASFGNVAMGGNNSKTLTLSNYGLGSATISQVSVSGKGFTVSKLATPLKLSAGQSISLQAHFAPEATGEVTGSIAITSNAWDRNLTIALSGTGIGAQGRLSATPASASFGDVVMGENGSKVVTISNTGTTALTISHLSVIGKGFSMSTVATPLKLVVGQSISLEAHFGPVTTGAATGSIAITSNASDPSLTIGLSGTGIGAQGRLSATPASASLGKVVVGENNSQTIRLNNTGDGSAIISRISVVGSGFKVTGLTVPTVIASGRSATFNVSFTPISSGSVTGTVSLVSDAPSSPLTISLSGTGVAATHLLEASPSGLNFGTVTVDTTSSLSLTLTNPGNADVTISKVAVSGAGFSQSGVAAGTILGPNQSTTLRVVFAPASAGSVNGDVAITSNAATSAMMISLAGTAVQPAAHSVALAWDASKSSGVVGYNVYRATVSGGPYTKLTPSAIAETQYTDTTVQAGHIYYYVVTSVDSSGVQSSYSNQVSVTIPAS